MGTLTDAVRKDKMVMEYTRQLAELFSKADPGVLEIVLKTKDYKLIAKELNIELSKLEYIQKFLAVRGIELASQFPELNIGKSDKGRFRAGAA